MQNRFMVIWSALLYFQLMLLGIVAFLASRTPEGITFNFDLNKFQGHPNASLVMVGLAACATAYMWPKIGRQVSATDQPKKNAGGAAMMQFIMPLLALEMVNLMGFLLAFLNNYDLTLMVPFTVLTVLGFVLNIPKNAAA